MFLLIRTIIWLAGLAVVGTFVLGYFGYAPNWRYFEERKGICQDQLAACQKDLLRNGLEGAKEKCEFECVDPKLFIKAEDSKE